ncbi:PepSY domain-containing protein [Paraburkholderia kururiensis]|uniref:PepSY domain-containing protein n=1 Tax=Paraburkholderia kururiensis TaxID=984307 RepID=UPI0005AB1BB0|nr:PepSY domain-containing protein [Paraburkholderia kururiensis]
MNCKRIGRIAAIAVLGTVAGHAVASPACTRQPESQWLSEADMQKKISQMGYKDIKVFKKTASGCYEIYGRTGDGRKAEVYFNPVTGAVVQSNVD